MKTQFLCNCLLVFSTLVGCSLAAYAQPAAPSSNFTNIDRAIIQRMDSANIPGLSIAIIQNKKLLYSQGYGLTKADSNQRVTSATVFDAASLSKPVFAYAFLQLVDEGLMSLDKPLYEYLPYPDVATDERYKKITARMVLSHSSGFPNWRKNRQSNELAMSFTPGERFGYSGEGFVYLQKVVEKLTGKPTNDLMAERVFKPLQMNRSGYVWNPAFDTNFARPHDSFGQPNPKGKSNQANVAYSLQTTADDYAQFVLALLTGKGLKPETANQMLSRQRQLPKTFSKTDSLSPSLSWGLGMGLESTPTGEYFWHWGDNGTFRCYVAADRNRGNAVVYFTNSFNGLSIIGETVGQFVGGNHPAVTFLGYDSYKADHKLFARNLLKKGVTEAIKPYLKNEKTTLAENELEALGSQLARTNHAAEALDLFRYAMQAYPDSAGTYAGYAYANLQNGNQAEAITYYNKSLALKGDNPRTKQIVTGLAAAQAGKGATKLKLSGYPNARLVTLAGSFNNWDNLHTFFVKEGDGWICSTDLKPGTYSYKVVVDGKWILDPANPATQTDEQGNVNSLLTVR